MSQSPLRRLASPLALAAALLFLGCGAEQTTDDPGFRQSQRATESRPERNPELDRGADGQSGAANRETDQSLQDASGGTYIRSDDGQAGESSSAQQQ